MYKYDNNELCLKLYRAKIISTTTDIIGTIKIKIIPDMNDLKDSDKLPLAEPFKGISNSVAMEFDSLKEGSLIWALCSQDFQTCYYLSEYNRTANFDFSIIENLVGNVTEASSIDISTIYFRLFYNGNLIIQNYDSGDYIFYHNSGSYTIYDTDGNIITYSKTKNIKLYNDESTIEMKTNGEIEIFNSNGNIKLFNDGKIVMSNGSTVTLNTGGQVDINGNLTVD